MVNCVRYVVGVIPYVVCTVVYRKRSRAISNEDEVSFEMTMACEQIRVLRFHDTGMSAMGRSSAACTGRSEVGISSLA